MSVIYRPWTEQPPGAVQVDRSNPLTAGLVEAYSPTVNAFRAPGTILVPSAGGVGIRAATNATAGATMPMTASRASGSGTVLFIAPPMSSTAAAEYFWDGDGAANRDLFYHIGTVYPGQFGWYVNSTLIADAGNSPIGNGFQGRVNVLRWANGAQSAWRNGALFQTWSRALTATTARNIKLCSRFSDNESLVSSSILLRAEWNRALTDSEIVTVSDNPWQLFEPRRILVPVSEGGGAGQTVAVPAGSLALAGFAPTVVATANQVVEVPRGALTLAGQTPTVTASNHQTIAVPAGTLTLAGQTPTVSVAANQTVAVPAGTLALAAFAPTVTATANNAIGVPLGTLALAGFAPNILNGAQQVVQVPLGTLALAGQTPTVAVSANQTISVPAGTLTLTGQAPTVVATNPQLINVPKGTLALAGFAPTVTVAAAGNNIIAVPKGALVITRHHPTIRVSTDADVFLARFAARSRITTAVSLSSRITTRVGLRSPLKD